MNLSRFLPFNPTFLLSMFVGASALFGASSLASAQDLEIVSINSPNAPAVYDSLAGVTFTVKNNSFDTVNFLNQEIEVTVDGGSSVRKVADSAKFILPGQSISVTLSTVADLYNTGTRTLTVRILRFDSNTANNSLSKQVVSLPKTASAAEVTAFPYFESFEMGAADWTSNFHTALYERSPNPGFGISRFVLGSIVKPSVAMKDAINFRMEGAADGTNAWKIGSPDATVDVVRRSAMAAPHTTAQVISPIFDLENRQSVELNLAVWWESAPGVDGAKVEYSQDNGLNWKPIRSVGEPENWYTTEASSLEAVGDSSGWGGYVTAGSTDSTMVAIDPYVSSGGMGYASAGPLGSDEWVTAKHLVPGGAKTRLRVIYAGRDGLDEGFAFDSVRISDGATATLAAQLVLDVNNDGQAGTGDRVRISTTLNNASTISVPNAVYLDLLAQAGLRVVPGTVTTSQGTVTIGNGPNDQTVSISLGTIAASSGDVDIAYDVSIGALDPAAVEACFQGAFVGAGFAADGLVTDDTNVAGQANPTCVPALVDVDGDGLPDGLDIDMDGLTNAEERIFGTEPNVADSDSDGVNDGDEVAFGTDPAEANNGGNNVSGEICTEWNGFLDFLTQILEQRNSGTANITVETKLYSITGALQSTVVSVLQPGQQRDIIVNELAGFAAGTYGNICSNIVSGPAGTLAGQYVNYRLTGNSYRLAFAEPFIGGRMGKQFISYNTFQPSLAAGDSVDFVAGWVQLSNDENSAQGGELVFYDAEGFETRRDGVVVAARGRIDIDIHSIGASKIGLIEWIPTSPTAKFRLRQKRYYFDGPLSAAPDLIAATSIPGQLGTGSRIALPVDPSGKTAVVELSNPLSTAVSVLVQLNNQAGAGAASETVVVPAKGSRHVVFSDILPAEGRGLLIVDANTAGGIVPNVQYYGRLAGGTLGSTDTSQLGTGPGRILTGSYNSFLNQNCSLQVGNRSSAQQTAVLNVTRYDGGRIFQDVPLTVPAGGTVFVDICANEPLAAYGEIRVTTSSVAALVGISTRQNFEETVEFSSLLENVTTP